MVETQEDYLKEIDLFGPEIIISDYTLPQFYVLWLFCCEMRENPLVPFILVTGTINEEVAVECMKAGADDYILKDNLSRLGPAIKNAVDKLDLIIEKKRGCRDCIQDSK